MKKLLLSASIVLGALGGSTAFASTGAVMSTDQIVKLCSAKNDATAQNFCNGYAQGVYDMYVASRHPKHNPAFLCFPNPGPSRQKAIDDYLAWAAKNPQFGASTAADSMMRYLAGAYPCKKK